MTIESGFDEGFGSFAVRCAEFGGVDPAQADSLANDRADRGLYLEQQSVSIDDALDASEIGVVDGPLAAGRSGGISALLETNGSLGQSIQADLFWRTQYTIQAIDALFDKPIFRMRDFVARSGIPRAAASRIVGVLRDQGIVDEIRKGSGRRGAILVFPELIEAAELLPS